MATEPGMVSVPVALVQSMNAVAPMLVSEVAGARSMLARLANRNAPLPMAARDPPERKANSVSVPATPANAVKPISVTTAPTVAVSIEPPKFDLALLTRVLLMSATEVPVALAPERKRLSLAGE